MFNLPLEKYPTETNKQNQWIYSLIVKLITLAQTSLPSPRIEQRPSQTTPLGYVKIATSLACLTPNSQPKQL